MSTLLQHWIVGVWIVGVGRSSAVKLDRIEGAPVTAVDGQPREQEVRIDHGQVEACVDYITRFRTYLQRNC